jgi:hypothetical protein
MPIKQGGTFASLVLIRLRPSFSRKTIVPWSFRPIKQRVLAGINANGAGDYSVYLLGHGGVLLVRLSPYRKPLGAGARPVHPILGSHARSEAD